MSSSGNSAYASSLIAALRGASSAPKASNQLVFFDPHSGQVTDSGSTPSVWQAKSTEQGMWNPPVLKQQVLKRQADGTYLKEVPFESFSQMRDATGSSGGFFGQYNFVPGKAPVTRGPDGTVLIDWNKALTA